MSLLTLIQGVSRRVNYPQPVSAYGNSDPNVTLMIDCAQDTGDELVERWGWQNLKLQSPAVFTGNGTTAAWPFPANLRTFQPDAIFVSSLYPTAKMIGPVNEDAFLRQKLIPVQAYPSIWRIVNNSVEFFPVLQPGEIVSYIYQGKYWITTLVAGVATPTNTFAADTDTVNIAERLVRLGARWRYRQAKGLGYDEEMRDYEMALDRHAGQESTERVVTMSYPFVDSFDDSGDAYIVGIVPTAGDFSVSDFSTDLFHVVRKPVGRRRPPLAQPLKFQAPVDGWRADVPVGDMPPNAAYVLQNWFPETSYTRVRNGYTQYNSNKLGGSVGTDYSLLGNVNQTVRGGRAEYLRRDRGRRSDRFNIRLHKFAFLVFSNLDGGREVPDSRKRVRYPEAIQRDDLDRYGCHRRPNGAFRAFRDDDLSRAIVVPAKGTRRSSGILERRRLPAL